jgi:hypothetical protein
MNHFSVCGQNFGSIPLAAVMPDSIRHPWIAGAETLDLIRGRNDNHFCQRQWSNFSRPLSFPILSPCKHDLS